METIPLVLGVLLAVIGLALLFDAWVPDTTIVSEERRRRPRRDRDRPGEALVGLGALAMSAMFFGRDTWRYSTIAAIAGALLLIWGTKRTSEYLRGVFSHGVRPKPKLVAKPKFAEGSRRVR
jgi:hypothetical protein